jgi:HPt (histidine-containing phosphotransfer) domain-containing protein
LHESNRAAANEAAPDPVKHVLTVDVREAAPHFLGDSIILRGLCRPTLCRRYEGRRENESMTASRPSATAAHPPAGPASSVIDDDHLRQMTLGDRDLEREVLEIFVRQAALMLRRIVDAKPALAAAAAHTLKGSARGIGAWRVAQAADRLERVATGGNSLEAFKVAIAELETASREARIAILARLADRSDDAVIDPPGPVARGD